MRRSAKEAALTDAAALDAVFRTARTHHAWLDRPVPDETLRELYDVLRLGPTSANCSPARFVFVASAEAKARLLPYLSSANRTQTSAAPVCVIVAYDTQFYENLPRLFPETPNARDWFTSSPAFAEATAFRNGTLQGAYLIVAARMLGLNCGPMSAFDNAGVDREFFPDGRVKSNFLCNLGYGDPSALKPRDPRLAFEEACEIL